MSGGFFDSRLYICINTNTAITTATAAAAAAATTTITLPFTTYWIVCILFVVRCDTLITVTVEQRVHDGGETLM